MRRERKVLVPFNRGRGARQLGIDLTVVVLDAGADQLRDAICHPAIAHHPVIILGDIGRRVNSAQRGFFGAVTGFEIEARATVDGFAIGLVVRPAVLEPVRELLAQGGQLFGAYRVFDQQVTLLFEERLLLVAQNHRTIVPKKSNIAKTRVRIKFACLTRRFKFTEPDLD